MQHSILNTLNAGKGISVDWDIYSRIHMSLIALGVKWCVF